MQLWFGICFCGKSKLSSCKRDKMLWFISGLLAKQSWRSLFIYLTIKINNNEYISELLSWLGHGKRNFKQHQKPYLFLFQLWHPLIMFSSTMQSVMSREGHLHFKLLRSSGRTVEKVATNAILEQNFQDFFLSVWCLIFVVCLYDWFTFYVGCWPV
jgi:hypothetical protein